MSSILIIFCFLKGSFKSIRLFILRKHISFQDAGVKHYGNEKDINGKKEFNRFLIIKKTILFPVVFFIALAVFFLIFKNIFIAIFFSTVVLIVSFEIKQRLDEKRREFFEIQIAEFISNMIILLKSGKNVRQIFKISLNWFKNPLYSYLKKFDNEVEFNIPFEKALDGFSKRADNTEINLLVNAIKINNKIGGNFLFIASNILKTVQDNIRIRTKIKTRTAQSRLSGNIIVFFPAIGFIFMYLIFNYAVERFISTTLGISAILIGTIFELAGYLIIKRIVREDYI
ncbi:MAG: type II secretion system F family protein [Actinomycetota bacterium]|nr:type II secretion system F family protein [Actinomycetota bacterium]